MSTKFIKMHGLGNDYVYFNLFQEKFPEAKTRELAIKISNRNFGVGGDGIVLIKPPKDVKNDACMQIYNADGSEAEMCGNAMRCVGKYLFETHFSHKKELKIETLAGIIKPAKQGDLIRVDMGEPKIDLIQHKLKVENFDVYEITTLSIGNPHCVIFVDDVENFPVKEVGSAIEAMRGVFPNRTNVEFVELINHHELKMRVWERGSGETLACGTGAVAALVAAKLNNFTDSKVIVHLKGGNLEIEWDQKTNHVFKTGPAIKSFEGSLELSDYLC